MFNPAGLKFPLLVNCTVVQNVAAVGGGVANDAFTLLTISNSIAWFNQPDSAFSICWPSWRRGAIPPTTA